MVVTEFDSETVVGAERFGAHRHPADRSRPPHGRSGTHRGGLRARPRPPSPGEARITGPARPHPEVVTAARPRLLPPPAPAARTPGAA
ncbi:hypothetical protein GCM10027168_60700 [Streptomyces capparidis]